MYPDSPLQGLSRLTQRSIVMHSVRPILTSSTRTTSIFFKRDSTATSLWIIKVFVALSSWYRYLTFYCPVPGNEYISIVEFAPNQKIPSSKEQKKRDVKINTIEQDPDYLKFLEMLENRAEVSNSPFSS